MPDLSGAAYECRTGTAKNFTLLLLLYLTQQKSQGMKQLMAGLGLILLAIILVPVLEGMMTGAV
ncbi:Maff2 family mobile element protein [Coprococcus sp. RTP31081st1_D2_RTP31081_211007]|uniref:Maff2 family mobile element protein n=1 Tax=unclassified Coprococcus TaxID=2684943 RepID=UPI0032EE24D8